MIRIVGALLLAVMLIGLGVHLMYQDAQAYTIYSVHIWRIGQGDVTDATVLFHFNGGGPLRATHQGYGIYKITGAAEPFWSIELDLNANPDYIGLDPWWGYESDVLLGDDPTQDWEVEPPR